MLAETTLARPYGRASFELADQAGTVEAWSSWLSAAAAVADTDAFQQVAGHPKVRDDQVLSLFGDAMDSELDKAFRQFLKVLMHYRRLTLLPEIAAQFETLRRAREHRLKVNVTSAVELDPRQMENLAERLRQRFGSDIEMETDVDEELIGGLIVRAGDKVIDASVRGRLEQLGRQLVR